MFFLSRFPLMLIHDFLSSWLYSRYLALLDTALCSKTDREILMVAFRCRITIFDGNMVYLRNDSYLAWLSLREIKVSSLVFSVNSIMTNRDFLKKYLSLNKSKVKSIFIWANDADRKLSLLNTDLIDLINSCPSLTSLRINGLKRRQLIAAPTDALPELERPAPFLELIKPEVGTNIEELIWFDCDAGKTDISEMIKLFPNMKSLVLHNIYLGDTPNVNKDDPSTADICSLFSGFKNLKYFRLNRGCYDSNDEITETARNHKHIKFVYKH